MYLADNIESPCNNNCNMDLESKLCKGCFRTLDEITSWSIASADEKKKILEMIHFRKEANKSSNQ